MKYKGPEQANSWGLQIVITDFVAFRLIGGMIFLCGFSLILASQPRAV